MKPRSFFALFFLLLWLAPTRAEVIRAFQVTIQVHDDTSFDVTERITMDFEGAQKHGIYRVMPIRYFRDRGTYKLNFEVQGVTDDKGRAYRYQETRPGNDLNLKIGDPNTFVTGENIYVIRYYVRGAVNFWDGEPEVYWNATGDQWPFAIQSAAVQILPPPAAKNSITRAICFRGRSGSNQPGRYEIKPDRALFWTENLLPGEGFTVASRFPKGSLKPPTQTQQAMWFLAKWWPAFLLPIFAAMAVATAYSSSGRDEGAGGAVGVEWNPPKGLSPAEVGTLVDEKCDMSDIVSTLIDLAARGYLTIQEIKTEKFLFLTDRDYIFTKQPIGNRAPNDVLKSHESQFLSALFGYSDEVTLSDLKNKFYKHLPAIRSAIYSTLTTEGYFKQNPENVRTTWLIAGGVTLGIGFFLLLFLAAAGWPSIGVGLMLSGVILLLSARAMPSKTFHGTTACRECLGFQRFVRLAEKDRLRVLAADDPTVFGRLLPFAMVLGVADEWADKFADLLTAAPDWYIGPTPYSTFNSRHFVRDLGTGMNSMGNTFSSQPSSGGSSSGFSGGSSGGGFGGGGGGSW